MRFCVERIDEKRDRLTMGDVQGEAWPFYYGYMAHLDRHSSHALPS